MLNGDGFGFDPPCGAKREVGAVVPGFAGAEVPAGGRKEPAEGLVEKSEAIINLI